MIYLKSPLSNQRAFFVIYLFESSRYARSSLLEVTNMVSSSNCAFGHNVSRTNDGLSLNFFNYL